MKVICRNCENLVDENDAVRMTWYEYLVWEQMKNDIPTISFYQDAHHRYTQLCIDCYKNDGN